ncbi:FAD binding domain-containing protein [Aspergillus filifer]
MSLQQTTDVLIVGAVPLWLAHTGINFRIIERRPNVPRRGQADGLSPRTMEILETFGISHKVSRLWEQGTDEMLWCRGADGNLIRMERFHTQPQGGVRWGHGTLQQGVVEEIMKKRITNLCGVGVEYETTLSELSFDSSQVSSHNAFVWSARLQHGPDKVPGPLPEENVRAKYVIGADGGRSFVRQAMGIEMQGTKGEAVWGVMDVVGISDFPDDIDGAVDFVRREQGMTRMYVELNKTVSGWQALDRESITPDSIIEKCRHIIRPYKVCLQWSAFTVGQRISDCMTVQSNGFLVGDAVHTHSPLCGAGMNTAVQDAYNLGWKLAGVLNRKLRPEVLSSYEAERRPVAEALLDADRTILDLFHAPLGPEADTLLAKAHSVQLYLAGRHIQYGQSLLTTLSDSSVQGSVFTPGKTLPDMSVRNYTTGTLANLHDWIKADGRWALIVRAGDLSTGSGLNDLDTCCTRIEAMMEITLSNRAETLGAFLIHCTEWPNLDLAELPSLFHAPSKYGGLDYGKIFVTESTIQYHPGEKPDSLEITVVRPDKHIGWTGGIEALDGLEGYLGRIFHRT